MLKDECECLSSDSTISAASNPEWTSQPTYVFPILYSLLVFIMGPKQCLFVDLF